MDNIVLIESETLRKKFCTEENTEVLSRLGELKTLPGTAWATKNNVAKFYLVGESTIDMIIARNKDELEIDGYKVLSAKEVRQEVSLKSKARNIAIFPRRAVLRVGMLLRDSAVAQNLRTYLLDLESPQQEIIMEMANQITQQSIQASKNAKELKALADISVDRSRMINAIVAEIYKNKSTIKDIADRVEKQEIQMEFFKERLLVLEGERAPKVGVKKISKKQINELKKIVYAVDLSPLTVWATFKRHFQLTKYTQLPQSKFEEAKKWLQNF